MNRLASGVIADQTQKRNEEDRNLTLYEMEREKRLREADERRMARDRQDKEEMR